MFLNNIKATFNRKLKIKISEILELKQRQIVINRFDLNNIIFLDDNDEPVKMDKKIVEDFKFCGLSNIDFITTGFYLSGFDGPSNTPDNK